MECKIGEIFEYNGEWYQCVKSVSCGECAFLNSICIDTPSIKCCADDRNDNCSVVFKKLEKVGEPYADTFTTDKIYNVLMQQYIVNYDEILPFVIGHFFILNPQTNTIAIELKQTKEDMEGNYKTEDTLLTRLVGRYVNNLIDYETFGKAVKELYSDKEESKPVLNEFDLEAAKAGKPVCTRDGRKARIICFDAKCADTPIVALVSRDDGEILLRHYRDGKLSDDKDSDADLMMLPEKKEGWVNVYKERIYSTKEEAIEATYDDVTYVDTVKVCWEE